MVCEKIYFKDYGNKIEHLGGYFVEDGISKIFPSFISVVEFLFFLIIKVLHFQNEDADFIGYCYFGLIPYYY